MAVSCRHLHHHLIQHHLPRNHLRPLLRRRLPAEGAFVVAAKSVDLRIGKSPSLILGDAKATNENGEKANRVSYVATFTEAHGVHASSYNLHNFLWERHQRRLFPLKDVIAVTQLSDVPLTKNQNLACLLAVTPVGNCQEMKLFRPSKCKSKYIGQKSAQLTFHFFGVFVTILNRLRLPFGGLLRRHDGSTYLDIPEKVVKQISCCHQLLEKKTPPVSMSVSSTGH